MDLLSAVTGTAWSAVFFIIALSVIVAIHEYGHYIVGRWSGIHAEVFSIGFGPVLVSRVDKRGTRWQLAAIPFGGFVKFLGDADAASVRSDLPSGLSAAERRHTMAGAPLWARAATVVAGPLANFILTFVILFGMMQVTGVAIDRPTIGEVSALPYAQPLQPGDEILSLAGIATPDNEALGKALGTLPNTPDVAFQIRRDGQELTVNAPNPLLPLIGSVQVKSAAIDAGLQAGDVILQMQEQDVVTFGDLQKIVMGSEGNPLRVKVWRAGETFEVDLTPRRRDIPSADGQGFETRWMVGLAAGLTFAPETRTPGLWETASRAGSDMGNMVVTTFSGLWHMIAGQISTCNMSGVIGMADAVGDAAKTGPSSFIMMLAVLSLGVGILNLFPVPVLDGGHLVFHAWEAVTGKPPSDGALRILMSVGLTLVLGLMLFALLNDVTCV